MNQRRFAVRVARVTALAVVAGALAGALAGAPGAKGRADPADVIVEVDRDRVRQGELFRATVRGLPPGELSGRWLGARFAWYPAAGAVQSGKGPKAAAGVEGAALLGAGYHASPGEHWVEVLRAGVVVGRARIVVERRDFPVEALTVAPGQEALIRPEDPAMVERRQREEQEVAAARSGTSPVPLWDGGFVWPLRGHRRITSEYGLVRQVNGVVSGRHSGLDLAAPTGTPVMASSGGRVVLAAEHLVTGRTVIVDHGWGVFSSYLHLSRIMVREGQGVRRGEMIGAVGSTGFSTGPHLHFAIMAPGGYVDPRELLDRARWPPSFASPGD